VIGFPLSERDAKLIEAIATQAPFDKGVVTIGDTFKMNPDKFSFNNSAWTEFLQTVIKSVTDGLGLPPNLPRPRADLYELLLYPTSTRHTTFVFARL
jgi:hypothetical protein